MKWLLPIFLYAWMTRHPDAVPPTPVPPPVVPPVIAQPGGIQTQRWRQAKLEARWTIAADKWLVQWQRTQAIYQRLEAARKNGVPALIIFGFHVRESDASMRCHLHEGSPLTHRTKYVPKGRPLQWNPPDDWYTSALDALYDYEHLERKEWDRGEAALDAAESYNGTGYRHKGMPSPYLWSGTTAYQRGKYVADGRFDSQAVDKQIGVAAILLRARERGLEIPKALQ